MGKNRLTAIPLLVFAAVLLIIAAPQQASVQDEVTPAKGLNDKPKLVSMTVTPKLLERMVSNQLTLKISFKDDGKNLRNGTLELQIDDSTGKSVTIKLDLKKKKFGRAKGKQRFKADVEVGDVDWIRVSGWLRDADGKASTPKRVVIEVAAADDDDDDDDDGDDDDDPEPPPPWGTDVGFRAEDFTLQDQDGNEVSLHDYWGSVILLDFSTTWCGPCQMMAEESEHLYQNYRNNGFMIITVMVEGSGGASPTIQDCQAWASMFSLTTPVLCDVNRRTFIHYMEMLAYPLVLIIDRNMVIRDKMIGYYGQEYIEGKVQQYLQEGSQVNR